jgi:hypothetical protein
MEIGLSGGSDGSAGEDKREGLFEVSINMSRCGRQIVSPSNRRFDAWMVTGKLVEVF